MPDRAQFRDTHRYLAAVATELAAPALRVYARHRVRGTATPPQEWRTGVILGAAHIGDVLYRTCSLDALHTGLPHCRWSYATSTVGAELLRGTPAVADVMTVPADAGDAVDLLRSRAFDVALCTDNIEHHRALALALRAGIPNRVAFGSKGFSALATISVPTTRASWPAQIRSMVQAVTGRSDAWPLRPRVHLDAADAAQADALWRTLPHPDAALTIVAAVTTRQAIGAFPPSLFSAILRSALVMEPEARVLLTGSDADRAVVDAVARDLGDRAVTIAGALPVRATIALFERAHAFLGSDSGPRHMANAAGIPVFFVRNMAVPEIEAGRYCETEFDLAPPGQYLPPAANRAALATIDRDAAAAALIDAARSRAMASR